MLLDISTQERDFLLELLKEKQTAMLHELHHTDTNEFEEMLKEKLELLEGLRAKTERLPG
jgi:hypothetical protein